MMVRTFIKIIVFGTSAVCALSPILEALQLISCKFCFRLLTLAELPSTENGQQRLTPRYDEMPLSLTRFSIGKSPLNNFKVTRTETMNKVPDSLFSDMSQYKEVIEYLLEDIQRGNHLVLVENEGLGNKKIADRLLQILDRPTEYIQMHRDTTIRSLTGQPNIKDGTVIYEDSPLVRAVKYGHVLVVDETDKAPTIVTSSLNTLMQNGEMILSDNRMIIPKEIMNSSGSKSASFIPVHKDFRMIVIASRTGFPFLEEDLSAPLVLKTGEIGTIVEAVGYSPVVTTAVMGGYSSGIHTATAIASGSARATATAMTYGSGISTATAMASGSSIADATAYSYDEGIATATASSSRSSIARAQATARGNQVITDTKKS